MRIPLQPMPASFLNPAPPSGEYITRLTCRRYPNEQGFEHAHKRLRLLFRRSAHKNTLIILLQIQEKARWGWLPLPLTDGIIMRTINTRGGNRDLKRLLSTILIMAILLQSVSAWASSRKNTIYKVPKYNGFKSYERGILENGKIIFKKGTKQYRLQKMAKTKDGFRKVKGRYLIAVGSRFTKNIGQYVTLVL